jgi:gentisate 1,2-dioxygenase
VKKNHNRSFDLYSTGGIAPRTSKQTGKPYSPQLAYRYDEVRPALDRLQAYEPDPYDGFIIEYVNPESGGPVMPTMSFTMQLLSPGQQTLAHRHTSSTIYCAVEGEGHTDVDGTRLHWKKHDVFVVPTWAWHEHVNTAGNGPAVLFAVTDAPAIKSLSLYREEGRTPTGDTVTVAQP